MTLLYLHSNCCSSTLICVAKKAKEREGGRERERELHFERGRRGVEGVEGRDGGDEDCDAAAACILFCSAAETPARATVPHISHQPFASLPLLPPLVMQPHNKCDNSGADRTGSIAACIPVSSLRVNGLCATQRACTPPLINPVKCFNDHHKTNPFFIAFRTWSQKK